jgi:hypothetical protein
MPRVKGGAVELNRLLAEAYIEAGKSGRAECQAEKDAWAAAEAAGWRKSDGTWRTAEEHEQWVKDNEE